MIDISPQSTIREVHLDPCEPSIIDKLEELLAMARGGKLSMIAAVGIERNGLPVLMRSRINNRTMMAGAVARLQHWVMEECNDG